MTKEDVVKEVSKRTGVEKIAVQAIVEAFMELVKDSMVKDKNIYFRGFGSFIVKKRAKDIGKKHRSLKADIDMLIDSLEQNPLQGEPLGKDCYKVRMAITSKGKGKSGGARIISYVYVLNEQIFLMDIYDKSERDNISDKEIKDYIKNLPIL